MYGLPKIHKSQEIKDKVKEHPAKCITVTHPSDLTMRPIIAGHSSVQVDLVISLTRFSDCI